ncbi:hypothetical protein VNI00_018820 [Paramarasmius palmivorus]|uniref:Uncharacterized protein n=1 Tax=Paramarasmius palmivorus TaxID=297713 RepID=A0AAW0AUI8_9AGAR
MSTFRAQAHAWPFGLMVGKSVINTFGGEHVRYRWVLGTASAINRMKPLSEHRAAELTARALRRLTGELDLFYRLSDTSKPLALSQCKHSRTPVRTKYLPTDARRGYYEYFEVAREGEGDDAAFESGPGWA